MPDIPNPSEQHDGSDPHGSTPGQDTLGTRAERNAALHARASEAVPITAVGEAGKGATRLANRIERANTAQPTAGRAFAQRAYEQGAAGEQEVAEQLKWLPGSDFWVLHDQPWPGRPKANIDHIVVGRTGVFVVDAKNWSGAVTLGNEGIKQNGSLRANTVSSLQEQAAALTALIHRLPISDPQGVRVTPILAFCGDNAPEGQHSGVFVRPANTLAQSIGQAPDNIRPEYVGLIAQELESSLIRDRANSLKQHSLNVKAYKARQADRETEQRNRSTRRNAGRPDNRASNSALAREKSSAASGSTQRSPQRAPQRSRQKNAAKLRNLLITLGVVSVLVFRPDLLSSALEWISTFISGLVTPTK